MNDSEYNNRLKEQTLIGQHFINPAFDYWLKDSDENRPPIPNHLKEEFEERTFRKFMEWTFNLSGKKMKETNGEILAEKFNNVAYDTALKLAENEDDIITIKCPGLPRIGDEFHCHEKNSEHKNMNEIIDRCAVKKNDKWIAIKIKFKFPDDKGHKETEFELKE
jgi:hypothetical protein